MRLLMSEDLFQEILDHCRREAPLEACGLVAGKNGRALKVYRLTNAETSPVKYLIKPEEQFKAMDDMERRGQELLAIYHSHPATQAYPSERDIRMAFYPDVSYLIVSLQGEVKARLFRIVEGEVYPETLEIVPAKGLAE